MIILGLLLLLLVLAVVVIVMLNGGDSAQLSLEWLTADTTVAGVFIAGAATVLVGVVGASLLTSGVKRSRRKRAEVKDLKAKAAGKESSTRREPTSASRTGQSAPTAGSSPTAVEPRSSDDPDGTDEYFESTPRDR